MLLWENPECVHTCVYISECNIQALHAKLLSNLSLGFEKICPFMDICETSLFTDIYNCVDFHLHYKTNKKRDTRTACMWSSCDHCYFDVTHTQHLIIHLSKVF